MSRHRKGELGAVPFRSGRFFYIDSKWYFACREGKEVGPFPSKQAAEMALAEYIHNAECVEDPRREDSLSPTYHPPTSP
jgi:hypothetical protein